MLRAKVNLSKQSTVQHRVSTESHLWYDNL